MLLVALAFLFSAVSSSPMAYPSIERMMIETDNVTKVESFWPWAYPQSACLGELWYTPLVSYFGVFNQYWWSDFNLIAFTDAKDTNEDACNNNNNPPPQYPGGLECGVKVGGRVAVGNNLIVLTEGSIGHDTQTKPGLLPYATVVGNNFGWPPQAGNIYPKTENIFVGGDVLRTDPDTPAYIRNRIRGRCHNFFVGSCLSISFHKAYWYYKLGQLSWAWHPTNAINDLRTEWDGKVLILTAAVPNLDRYYLTFPETVFADLKAIELIGFPADAEFVINIHLSQNLLISKTGKFPALVGNYPGRVAYNFLGYATITIQESRLPSVLAPDSTINQKSGRIEGFAIADCFDELGTVHIVDCTDETRFRDARHEVKWFM